MGTQKWLESCRTQDFGMQISDFECAVCMIFQSAIRNLKSAINFAPVLHYSNAIELKKHCEFIYPERTMI